MNRTPAYVRLDRRGPVVTVTMDNPVTLNGMDDEMGPRLARTLEGLARDPEARVVILTGAGGNFSGGGNLKRAAAFLEEHPGQGAGEIFANYLQYVIRVALAITALPQPLICAVEGASSGAGLSWMAAGDLAVAAEDARLVPGFVKVGLVPGAGGTYHFAHLFGPALAAELFMLGDAMTPARAHELGLVTHLAPPGAALAKAHELAQRLAEGPAQALAATKRLLGRAVRGGLAPHLELERQGVVSAADDPEFAVRVRRFMNRHAPKEK
ncbi:enoyl-CoA hydratase/isomerase family protein [Desulfoferula mesophila]|uniref:Enoyl-CoA hydratase n=1 Tax=Desulfoferula mesophila TaxID=3058419 RepID=A0AAU9EVB9_9BACT|nr:enoyl-CoA hydratase [Desulfoferula mesophilus]